MDRSKYLELISPAIVLVQKKHQDYNKGLELDQYFPFGDASYVQMLHVKQCRLLSLVSTNATENFESKKDTVLDLINYAVFYLAYLNNLEKI